QGESAGQEGDQRCNWSSTDELHLLDYVTTHKAKGGDGLNFDKKFWTQAATDVAHTTTMVRNGRVFFWHSLCPPILLKQFKMCATYTVANFSGISWSHELGANIMPESESVWAYLVRVSSIYCFLLVLLTFSLASSRKYPL
ncbi:hypothetical protein BDR05DRAFT_890585, partial [Suillus weaverae]